MKPNLLSRLAIATGTLSFFVSVALAETQKLSFSEKHRDTSVYGLEVEYLGPFQGSAPLDVYVECVSGEETPELVLESVSATAPARLINTTDGASNCGSYIISTAAADEYAIGFINVGISVGGIAQQHLSDASVFIFNAVEGNWTKAEEYKPNRNDPTKAYTTLSENYVQAISGVIVSPDLPSAEPFSRDMLSETLESVDPLQGLLEIPRIEPDSTGQIAVDLPLLLRPSRGAGPSFSVTNSPNAGTGVLGRGWDLNISAIQVRGPSPIYHPEFETEDYVLNGQELIALDAEGKEIPPLYKGGPIVPRVDSVRVFRPRNATRPLIIRRYGNAPDNYFWEVWDPGRKVTQLFGAVLSGDSVVADSQSTLTTTMPLGSAGGIINQQVSGKWGLSQEYDNQPARSGSRYFYDAERACSVELPNELRVYCSQDLRIKRITYNNAFSEPLPGISASGVTYVDFDWKGRVEQRFTTQAKLGFLTSSEHWLSSIEVHYPATNKNKWLAGLSVALPDGNASEHILYGRYDFELSKGNDPCLNFDKVLSSVTVTANTKYSDGDLTKRDLIGGSPSEHSKQVFEFSYTGEIGEERCPENGILDWKNETIENPLEGENAKSGIGFPDGLLERVGLKALTSSSLLGESNTDETGASIYVGIGVAGDTSDKAITGGIKAGLSFMQTRGGSTLIDVTGDGIDDIVMRTSAGLKYCAATRQPNGSIVYKKNPYCGEIYGLNDIAISSSSTQSYGVEGYHPVGFYGIGYNSASSETYVYPTDRDGDGLTDFAVYGRVVYGQGETCPTPETCFVQFSPNSALTPPIPGSTGVAETLAIENRRPPGFTETINRMRTSLEALRTRFDNLSYSQTSIAWEAPLTGTLQLEGQFKLNATFPKPLETKLISEGLRDYPGLRKAAHAFDEFLNDCDEFPKRPHCPSPVGAGHTISFPETPPAFIQLELSRTLKNNDNTYTEQVEVCGADALPRGGTFEIADLLKASSCGRQTPHGPVLDVEAGDLLYLSYSVHPDFTASLQPDARYAYRSFLSHNEKSEAEAADRNRDPAFDLDLRFGEFGVEDIYNCTWRDQFPDAKIETDCLLNRQNRYTYSLATGLLTSNASAAAHTPKGSKRKISGQFALSASLTQDYVVSLEMRGLPTASGNIRSADLPLVFSQNVTTACETKTDSDPSPLCEIDIELTCATSQSTCDAFLADDAEAWRIALNLNVKHAEFPEQPVLNLDSRLTSLVWQSPPRLTTEIKEVDEHNPAQPKYTRQEGDVITGKPKESVSRNVVIYLPVMMGTADVERRRVTDGEFVAPNDSLNEGSPNANKITLEKIIDDEISNVAVARVRQRYRLCGFADEIINFLEIRDVSSTSPFAPSRFGFWREKFLPAEESCFAEGLFIQSLDFKDKRTGKVSAPEFDPAAERLRLRERLELLPIDEQVSSAESLLVRVLKNLELPREALTAHPELGEMGYRLPVKANPFDCGIIDAEPTTIDHAIYGAEAPCRYRVLMNFAMESILNLFPDEDKDTPHPKRLAYEAILADLLSSKVPAFNLELAITVNGRPTLISELTGADASSTTGNINPGQPLKGTCIGSYGAHPAKGSAPTHFYPDTTTIGGAAGSTIFQRILTNRRSGRAVAFSDDVLHTVIQGRGSSQGLGVYSSLYQMEAKQDCVEMEGRDGSNAKYTGPPTPTVAIQILENNSVSGRNRIFEFDAHPLDVVAFHVRLKPIPQVFPTTSTQNVDFELDGKFSVLDNEPTQGPRTYPLEEYIIPRSPSQIVPPNLDAVDCGESPLITGRKLVRTCRPWTRIAWSELLLGAAYRTYSDAHKTLTDKEYSIKRRRDLLRIFPEIEIASDEFRLETEKGVSNFAPIAGDQYVEPATAYSIGIAERTPTLADVVTEDSDAIAEIGGLSEFISEFYQSGKATPSKDVLRISYYKFREPNVGQIGDAWAFWAQKSNRNGTLTPSPTFSDLRYLRSLTGRPPADPNARYNQAKGACLDKAGTEEESAKFGKCENDTRKDGRETLSFNTVDIFPLQHRFIGPTHEEQSKIYVNQLIATTDVCAIPTPNTFASCWAGADDTVFFHQQIPDINLSIKDSGEHRADHPTRSVSAFIGFEQPLVEQFKFDLDALMRVACNGSPKAPTTYCDGLSPSPNTSDAEEFSEFFGAENAVGSFKPLPSEPKIDDALPVPTATPAGALVRAPPAVPNRPNPPDPATALHVFAPIQQTRSESVSANTGVDISGLSFNTNRVHNRTKTRSLFLDINGDGFPEHLTGNGALSGDLSSPVGLLRSDWWRYFKSPGHSGSLVNGTRGSGYKQDSRSGSSGVGIGLTPPTFARIHQASMDAVVSPSFNLSFESGKQKDFNDLKDFNGDGILDVIGGTTVNAGIRVNFNLGNTVSPGEQAVSVGNSGDVLVGGDQPYRTTYSSGFGVRLGFSINSGSIKGGMGLGARVQSSDGVLVDFTGDGRVDIVVPVQVGEESHLAVFPNVGNGYLFGRLHKISGWSGSETSAGETTLVDAGAAYTFGFNAWFIKVVFNPAVKKASNQFRELLSLRDVNGDGFPDLARVSGVFKGASNGLVPNFSLPDKVETVFNYNPDATYHLLARVSSPTKVEQEITYALHGNTGPELGRTIWVVDKISVFDGFAPADNDEIYADGQDVRVDDYSYSDGYFNRAEKNFYGFANISQTTFGCDRNWKEPEECLSLFDQEQSKDPGLGYVLLQKRLKQLNNRDYLTKGTLVAEVTTAPVKTWVTNPANHTPRLDSEDQLEISAAKRFSYAIEHLSNLGGASGAKCSVPSQVPQARWDHGKYSVGSALPTKWQSAGDRNVVRDDDKHILGSGAVCSKNVRGCHAIVSQKTCEAGYWLEQTQFWAQQSGSVRNRFSDLHILASGKAYLSGKGVSELVIEPAEALYSASATDFDQWGQQINAYNIGDLDLLDNPIPASSVHTSTSYAERNGLSAGLAKAPGTQTEYPILSLAQTEQVFKGPWSGDGEDRPIRVREALFQGEHQGSISAANVTDICQYPLHQDNSEFSFRPGICKDFKQSMQTSLTDGLSSLVDAQERAYQIPGLPTGTDRFDAIQHTQISEYDKFGNPTATVTPLTDRSEWLEQRYEYSGDTFLRNPTEIRTTRCVVDRIGAGSNSPGVVSDECAFGLDDKDKKYASEPRLAVTHSTQQRIDPHHGVTAGRQDANGNRILLDFDQWGRIRLLARDWGAAPRQNRAFEENMELAVRKNPLLAGDRPWNILAAVNYGWPSGELGSFSSHTQMFASSDAYEGASGAFDTARNAAVFKDGLGRLIQSRTEAEVCDDVDLNLLQSVNRRGGGDPLEKCGKKATSRVTVGGFIDAMGREFAAFEGYAGGNSQEKLGPVFEQPAKQKQRSEPVVTRIFDSGNRQISEQHRLALNKEVEKQPGVKATKQLFYDIVEDDYLGHQTRRFRTLALSPRCALTAAMSDPRGLPTSTIESQAALYTHDDARKPEQVSAHQDYERDYLATAGQCQSVEDALAAWSDDESLEANAEVTYEYDALLQLVGVEYPLSGVDRAAISVEYDRLGRMVGTQDPDSGCTQYVFDNLNNLVERRGSAYDEGEGKRCNASKGPHDLRTFEYSADRIIALTYRSLTGKGGVEDQADTVAFFYDRLPHTTAFGEILEAPRVIPNEHANQRFFDVTGKVCENCIGQITLVADRTGARSYNFNELGQVKKETRSIVGPVKDADHSDGEPETYLPELAFYELENSYSSFGDITMQEFNEGVPTNPSKACIKAGPNSCISRFTIGTRYAPDGSVATLLLNDHLIVRSAKDRLSRPSMRLMSDGTVTGFFYDDVDLKLKQMATITAAVVDGKYNKPVQITGYQYDGGGNIHGYQNAAKVGPSYLSHFNFGYDGANRLKSFDAFAKAEPGVMSATGSYGFDLGHRLSSRALTINGDPGTPFTRRWNYDYVNTPSPRQPVHAPNAITFDVPTLDTRRVSQFEYDDIGRLAKIKTAGNDKAPGVLSNRRLDWDAAGRLKQVLGGPDGYWSNNTDFLREEYIYDFAGNRALKIHRPLLMKDEAPVEHEITSIYLTPFYSRPADGRGTVQLSKGDLPVASAKPHVSETAEPQVTYLYPDLAVGTITASVLATGEVTNAEHTLVARREFSPFGLELTGRQLANLGDTQTELPSAFHGKELDRTTGFSSFGARYYSRELGTWASPDPMQSAYLFGRPAFGVFAPRNLSTFAFAGQNPITHTDVDGNAAVAPLLLIGLGAYTLYEGYKAYQDGGAKGLAKFAGVEGTAIAVAGPVGKVGSKFGRAAFAKSLPYLEKALNLARSTKAPQWVVNRLSGKIAEKQAAISLIDRGHEVIGTQMHARLKGGGEVVFDLVTIKNGKLFAAEVKSGGALLTKGQNQFFYKGGDVEQFFGRGTIQNLLDAGVNPATAPTMLKRLYHGRPTP